MAPRRSRRCCATAICIIVFLLVSWLTQAHHNHDHNHVHDHDHDAHHHHHHGDDNRVPEHSTTNEAADFPLRTRIGLAVACSVGISLVSLVGIVTLAETLFRRSRGSTKQQQQQQQQQSPTSTTDSQRKRKSATPTASHHHHDQNALHGGLLILVGLLVCLCIEIAFKSIDRHVRKLTVKPMAWLNLIGDCVHNFMDGIAISAGFLASTQLGLTTTLSTLFHELPQELSDFSVLISAGLAPSRALFFNLVSGLLCVVGCVAAFAPHLWGELFFSVDLTSSSSSSSSSYQQLMLALTTASFLYISLVDMLPEVLDACSKNLKNFGAAMLGLFCGVLVMYLLGRYEDAVQSLVTATVNFAHTIL